MKPMDLTVVAPRCHCGHLLNAWSKPPGQPFPRRSCPLHPPAKKRRKYRRRSCALHGAKLPCLACKAAADATAAALADTQRVAGGPRSSTKPKPSSAPRFLRAQRDEQRTVPLPRTVKA